MCLENYIGIRGECSDAKLYLDDLPGIDLVKVSNVTNETHKRPKDIVDKAFNQALKEVLQDVLGKISLQYNQIVDDKSYQYAGAYEYYGLNSDIVTIKVWKALDDKFIQLHLNEFELMSDRDATVDFVISDGYGISDTLTVDLVTGLNKIVLDVTSNSEYLKITFGLDDFKVGIKQTNTFFTHQTTTCNPCQSLNSVCDCSYIEVSQEIGFNLTVRCESDECKLIEYLTPIMDLPLLYKTGINYLLEIKMSGRMNAYIRNTDEAVEHMLTLWMGGYNNESNMNVSSVYWQKVKQVASKIDAAIRKLQSPVFTHAGSHIVNTLPG